MSTPHITPTPGRIVWYRGADGQVRPAIVTKGNGQFNADLYVFPLNGTDTDWGTKATVTHADPEQEPGCLVSWHWMPYQKQQAEKQANEVARASEPKTASADTSDAARLQQHIDMVKESGWTPGDGAGQQTGTATLPADHPVQQLANAVGGTIESLERLPDGSGACVMSMPLPANHWLTQPGYNEPPMPFQRGTADPERQAWAEKIRVAARYAVRASTMNGEIDDFDPDAMVQNFVVGMLGYWTPDGTSSDSDLAPAAVEQPAQ